MKAWKRYCEYQSKSDKKHKQKVEKSDIVETKKENEENEDQVEEKVADEPKEQVESKDTEQVSTECALCLQGVPLLLGFSVNSLPYFFHYPARRFILNLRIPQNSFLTGKNTI